MSASEMLKTTEAAVVSRVAIRDVNRVIDDGILPEGLVTRDDGRYILAAACMFVSFYFEAATSLTPEERLFAIETAVPRLRRPRSLTERSSFPTTACGFLGHKRRRDRPQKADCNRCGNKRRYTAAVVSFRANHFGLYDMQSISELFSEGWLETALRIPEDPMQALTPLNVRQPVGSVA